MSKRNRIIFIIFALIIAATLCFIFGNSFETGTESKQKSDSIIEKVEPILEPIVGEGKVTETLVRKTAHGIEFAALGFEVMLLLALIGKVRGQNVFCAFAFCLICAVTDESIQLLGDRGPLVSDILLDTAAATVALLFVLAVWAIVKLIIKQR